MRRLGHAWTDSTVSQVETGRRRVNTDELVALALALTTSVADLLTPPRPEKLDTGVGAMRSALVRPWVGGLLVVVPTWDTDGQPGEPRIETASGLPFRDIEVEGVTITPEVLRRMIEPKGS
jgi:hypothetical protein